jgi:molybdenum cofactor cytidylyltransferase
MSQKTGIVLLAAGAASRMGVPKQLLDYEGKPLFRHAAEAALAAGCGPVLTVLGCGAGAVAHALDGLPVALVLNPAWEEGMGRSIRAGVRAAAELDVEAVIIALADQPQISGDVYRRLLEVHEETGAPIVASSYGGAFGAPALFSREVFPALTELAPGEGCRQLIQEHPGTVTVPCAEALTDLDTPDDYRLITGSPELGRCSDCRCCAAKGCGALPPSCPG